MLAILELATRINEKTDLLSQNASSTSFERPFQTTCDSIMLNTIIGAIQVADADGHMRQAITQSDGSGVEANQSVILLGLSL